MVAVITMRGITGAGAFVAAGGRDLSECVFGWAASVALAANAKEQLRITCFAFIFPLGASAVGKSTNLQKAEAKN